MERESGFYWVKLGEWTIGELHTSINGNFWCVLGCHDDSCEESELDEIGERIEPPKSKSKDTTLSVDGKNFAIDHSAVKGGLVIKTLEGFVLADIGDMIIKGVKGEFYPCKPDIFAMTYDIEE